MRVLWYDDVAVAPTRIGGMQLSEHDGLLSDCFW